MVKNRFVTGAKHIPLSQGKFAIVDEDDYWKLSKFKWSLDGDGYAIRGRTGSTKGISYTRFIRVQGENIKLRNIKMHQEIISAPDGLVCDHINRNKLDNRKSNLRIVTIGQNCMNRIKMHNCAVAYKGVSKEGNKYVSRIQVKDLRLRKRGFINAIDAAKWYDEMALKYHGEFACTNKMLGLL